MNQKKPAKKPQIKRDYKIVSKLDAGGMGVVYKAVKKSTGEMVALKVLPPKFAKEAERLTRFNREIMACSRLDHPNLIRIIDNGCEDNLNYFTMEFFPGLSLRKMLKRDGPFSLERTADVALQMAKGCSYAHQKSLIHRDLKPDNILLNDDGLVKIIDFGLAKIRDITTMTRMDQALGTTRYLAPEIILGQPIDCRADIYQMGLIFYELLTGERVFAGNNPMALVRAYVYGGQPLSFFGFSVKDENWSNLLYNCLSVKADNRYSTSSALITDLEKLKIGGKVSLLTSQTGKTATKRKSLKVVDRPSPDSKSPAGKKERIDTQTSQKSEVKQAGLRIKKSSTINRIMPWIIVFILISLAGTAYYLRKVQVKDLVINSTYDSATIKWQTSSASTPILNYSLMNEEFFQKAYGGDRGTSHTIKINDLQAGQRYRFHFLLSGNRQSRQYVFKTQKPQFSNLWFIRKSSNESPLLSFTTKPPTICSIKYPGTGTTNTLKEKEIKTKHNFILSEMAKAEGAKAEVKVIYRFSLDGPESTEQWHISGDQKIITGEE